MRANRIRVLMLLSLTILLALSFIRIGFGDYVEGEFDLYTEVSDEGNELSQTTTKASWTELDRNDDCYIYHDYGEGSFHDFVAYFQLVITDIGSNDNDYRALVEQLVQFGIDHPSSDDWFKIGVVQYFDSTGSFDLKVSAGSGGVQDFGGYAWANPRLGSQVRFFDDTTYYMVMTKSGTQFKVDVYTNGYGGDLQWTTGWESGSDDYYSHVVATGGCNSTDDGSDHSTGYIQNLQVDVGDETLYFFYGVYDEDTGEYLTGDDRAVNITAYWEGSPPETFALNGSTFRAWDTQPLYLHFNLSNPRQYWFSTDEEKYYFHIYETDTTVYTITFLDMTGVLDLSPYIVAQRNVNGSLLTVEKRKTDETDKITMSLKSGEKYNIILEGETTFTFGDLLFTSDTDIELNLQFSLPSNVVLTYRYVRMYASREYNTSYAEVIDQQQTEYGSGSVIFGEVVHAQSYAPTKNIQTAVAFICRRTTIIPEDDLYLEIRLDNSSQPDMTAEGLVSSKSLAVGNFSTETAWVTFNHPNFEVDESLYWLVSRSPNCPNASCGYTIWRVALTPYTNGDYIWSSDNGTSWADPYLGTDQGFITYGYNEDQNHQQDTITMLYEDTKENTDYVECYIKYLNGSTAYSTNQSSNSFSVQWASANYTITYYVEMDCYHGDYGELNYRATLYRGGFEQTPWGLDWLGSIPNLATSTLLPMFLIFAVAGISSKVNAYFGAFMAVILAGLLAWWGWIDIPVGMLIVGLAMAILMALAYKKKEVRTL